MNFPLEQLAALPGLISTETGMRLATLASDVAADLAVVELGSHKGKSTCYLAVGASQGCGAHVWAFDAWDLPGNPSGRHGYADPAVYDAFRANITRLGLEAAITGTRQRSAEAASSWAGPPVGLLYIDASHVYDDVRGDYVAWERHLAVGAVVAFDDYGTRKNPGVKRAVDEFAAEGRLIDLDLAPATLAVARRSPA